MTRSWEAALIGICLGLLLRSGCEAKAQAMDRLDLREVVRELAGIRDELRQIRGKLR